VTVELKCDPSKSQTSVTTNKRISDALLSEGEDGTPPATPSQQHQARKTRIVNLQSHGPVGTLKMPIKTAIKKT